MDDVHSEARVSGDAIDVLAGRGDGFDGFRRVLAEGFEKLSAVQDSSVDRIAVRFELACDKVEETVRELLAANASLSKHVSALAARVQTLERELGQVKQLQRSDAGRSQ
jgi:hypothetical protein